MDQAKVAPITETSPILDQLTQVCYQDESPFVINVVPGWVSTLTFSDSTGEYWPVQVVTNGNPDVYDVVSSGPDGESNIITISAKQAHISNQSCDSTSRCEGTTAGNFNSFSKPY